MPPLARSQLVGRLKEVSLVPQEITTVVYFYGQLLHLSPHLYLQMVHLAPHCFGQPISQRIRQRFKSCKQEGTRQGLADYTGIGSANHLIARQTALVK